MTGPVVVGIDGCPDGWVAVLLTADDVAVRHLGSIADVDHLVPAGTVVAIDMPMWIPTDPPRASEIAAKAALHHKASSVFPTPIRKVLEAPDHTTANAVSKELTGKGVSAQSFALAKKILEVDAWRATTSVDAYEVHPELSFTMLMGHPAKHSKKTWVGIGERRSALLANGVDLRDHEATDLGRAAVDDVVDAAVAAWSARRILVGAARSFPEDSTDGDVIWA